MLAEILMFLDTDCKYLVDNILLNSYSCDELKY